MNAPIAAEDIPVGTMIHYRSIDVRVMSERVPDENQFGLPWFKYRVRAADGREGWARFGPGGMAATA